MTRSERYASLINSISAGLNALERADAPLGEAAAQLIKAGIVLSIAANGSAATLAGLREQYTQLAREFQTAPAATDFPPIAGTC